jgi:hypothetical protein
MYKDKSICKECEKNNIKGYYIGLRHCKRCDNYEAKIAMGDITVMLGEVDQIPYGVEIDCPHCLKVIDISYSDFVDLMQSDFIGDWTGEIIQCPSCRKKIVIDDIGNSGSYYYKDKSNFD